MKKLVLSLFGMIALAFLVASCSPSIEQQEVKPLKEKVDVANRGKWLESIISNYTNTKGSRTATLCGNGTGYLGDLGIMRCTTFPLNVPSNVECGYFSAVAGSAFWNNWGLWYEAVYKPNSSTSSPDAHIYIIKDDGALIAYGFNNSTAGYGGNGNLAEGTLFYVVIIKTSQGDGVYKIDTHPQGAQESCGDLL